MADKLDTGISALLEKKAERVAARLDKKAERAEQGIVNSLIIDREPSGLYYARYSLAGNVPDELKGMFTHKSRIVDIATRRNIPLA
jgi:hypothetical protein